MAIALVQSSTEVSVVGTTSGNVTLTVTAGNLLVVTLSQTVAKMRRAGARQSQLRLAEIPRSDSKFTNSLAAIRPRPLTNPAAWKKGRQ